METAEHNPYIIRLSYENSDFIIKGYLDSRPYPVSQITKSNLSLNKLLELCSFKEFYTIDKLETLGKFINFFKKNKLVNISFRISKEMKDFKFYYKHDFRVKYAFNPTFKCLIRQIPQNAELHKNYFKIGHSFFNLANPIDFDFSKEFIDEQNLVKFVKDELPHIRDSVFCDLEYSEDKPLNLGLISLSRELIEISYSWVHPLKDFIQLNKPGYILVNNKIYFIPTFSSLKRIFKSLQSTIFFKGYEIPYFMDRIFPIIKYYFAFGADRIQDIKIYSEDFKPFLKAYLDQNSVVGKVYAKYSLKVNGITKKLDQLEDFTNLNSKYIALDEKNWILRDNLSSFNTRNLSEFLKTYILTEKEIIYRSSEKLPTLYFDDIDLPQNKDKIILGKNHLKFLLKYGMSGGVIAEENNQYMILKAFLAYLSYEKPLAKTLVIVDNKRCSKLIETSCNAGSIFIDSSKTFDKHIGSFKGIFVMPWKLINHCINFLVPKWDIVIFASIEELIQVSNIPFESAVKLKPSIWLNLSTFEQNLTLLESEKSEISKLFEYYNDESVNKYLFRNISEELHLPPPLKFTKEPTISTSLTKPIDMPLVNIDMEKVKLLKTENIEIVDLLAKKEENKFDEITLKPQNVPPEEKVLHQEQDIFHEFLSKLPEDEFKILKYIIDNKGSCEINEINKNFKDIFINAILDDINSLAKNIIGDLIIYDDMGKIYIEEEYIVPLSEDFYEHI